MERLARLAYRIVWVNPRVERAAASSPRAGGMAAALPHVDALVSGHSLDALGEVADAIAAERGAAGWVPDAAGARGRRGAMGERDAGAGQLGRDAQRLRPEPRQHDAGVDAR